MRVAVRVEKSGDEAWQVDIDIDGAAWTHRMRREKQGASVLCWPADPGDLDLGRTFDALDRIADRAPEGEDMAAVGGRCGGPCSGPAGPA
jgi:hypothetical protein